MSLLDESAEAEFRSSESTIALHQDRLVITDAITGEVRHVALTNVANPPEHFDRRFWTPAVILIVLFAAFFKASLTVAGPSHLSDTLQISLGILAFSCLIGLPDTLTPIPGARVKNHQGETLFEIFREKGRELAYEEFLLRLQRRLASIAES